MMIDGRFDLHFAEILVGQSGDLPPRPRAPGANAAAGLASAIGLLGVVCLMMMAG